MTRPAPDDKRKLRQTLWAAQILNGVIWRALSPHQIESIRIRLYRPAEEKNK